MSDFSSNQPRQNMEKSSSQPRESNQQPIKKEAEHPPTQKTSKKEKNSEPDLVDLFNELETSLIYFTFSLLKRRDIAEEIVQEAFLKLHQQEKHIENPKAWLYQTSRNLSLNHLRKYKRETEIEDESKLEDHEIPLETLQNAEAISAMKCLITKLPPKEQQLINLKYNQEKTYAEIAKLTNLSIGNVGYKLHHLLNKLAAQLKKSGIQSSKG